MFEFIKNVISAFKLAKGMAKVSKIYKAEMEKYATMPLEEFKKTPDEDLCEIALMRISYKTDKYKDTAKGIKALSNAERTFYASITYEMEVNNGGLCQFFVNSSRELAPYLSDSLAKIGANEHKEHFDKFIKVNGIDANDLTSFIIYDEDEFENQKERYPFDEFDDKFYEMESLEKYMVPYIREHIDEFESSVKE